MAATDDRARNRPNSVWLTERPPLKRKAEQPAGLDLDKIVAATVRLLDAEGLAKFSMRRLAAELGVTAMSVYWYVDTKDDLLELAVDAVAGEIVLPDGSDEAEESNGSDGSDGSDEAEESNGPEGSDEVDESVGSEEPDGPHAAADWRDQLRVLATGYRDMLLRHPWAARLLAEFINIGPHSTAFANATLRVMRRTGLGTERTSGALASLFHFVYGFSTIRATHEARCRAAGISLDDYFEQVMAAIKGRPEFAETMELSSRVAYARQGQSALEMLDRDFTFALDLQIAGIEAMRDRGRG